MSTRSQLWFYDTWGHRQPPEEPVGPEEATAVIYHHFDGYPYAVNGDKTEWGRLFDIKAAFDASKRKNEASDVATVYIKLHRTKDGDVYVDNNEHGDLSYAYQIWYIDGEPWVRVRTRGVRGHILAEGSLEVVIAMYRAGDVVED